MKTVSFQFQVTRKEALRLAGWLFLSAFYRKKLWLQVTDAPIAGDVSLKEDRT